MSTSSSSQRAILAPVPAFGRFAFWDHDTRVDARPALLQLRDAPDPDRTVVGVGQPLALALGAKIPGLRPFPAISGPDCSFPSTQNSLFAFLAAPDLTSLHDRTRQIASLLGEGFHLREEVSTFKYRDGRDLTGYEDGTENPKDDRAIEAAIAKGRGLGIDGSSFVAVQKYVHDLARFASFPSEKRDQIIGRRLSTNEEMADAPKSAHVKRAAQESFEPPAFMVRRSMPWGGVEEHGLVFVAYGESLDRFERVLTRMAGLEDGIVDGMLNFTRAVTGGYYWCPPARNDRIDWSALGIED
jgi:porphyrinogen peroxidase